MKKLLTLLLLTLCCGVTSAQSWHKYEDLKSHRELSMRFRTNSPSFTIRYTIDKKSLSKSSVEAIDLFVINNNGEVIKQNGKSQKRGESYIYSYEGMDYTKFGHKTSGFEFQLWLPAQCKIESLEIGTQADASFSFASQREELPIVVYLGDDPTTQSAAQRWTAMVSRQIDRPLIETSQVEDMTAKIFIVEQSRGAERLVSQIRAKHPNTPIVIRESKVMAKLESSGMKNIHLMEGEFKDAQAKADSYEKLLREVLHCPKGTISTTIPVTQRRVRSMEWQEENRNIIRELKNTKAKNAIVGNSITQNWGSEAPYRKGMNKAWGIESWKRYMSSDYVNLGIGADRIENVLWRVYNDQMEIKQFEKILIMIGTNNLNKSTPYEDIVAGLDNLVEQIQIRQPKAKIVILCILPRSSPSWSELQRINLQYKEIAKRRGVEYKCVGGKFMDEEENQIKELFRDRVHINAKGYEILGEALQGE